jgi:hypothetical protein
VPAVKQLAVLAVPRRSPRSAAHPRTGRYQDGGPVSGHPDAEASGHGILRGGHEPMSLLARLNSWRPRALPRLSPPNGRQHVESSDPRKRAISTLLLERQARGQCFTRF